MTGLDLATGSKHHPLSERGDDCYETPPEATRALLRAESLPRLVWEPACGPGAIVTILRAAGHHVVATDLVDYGCPDSAAGRDFLMEQSLPLFGACIVTNPPFKLAQKFVEKALELKATKVVMLARLAFLESQRREAILQRLSRVHVFSNRLPMMHRKDWSGPRSSSAMAFAWFVWDANHSGATELRRISWEAAE